MVDTVFSRDPVRAKRIADQLVAGSTTVNDFGLFERPNALYRNLGNWKFQDITAAATGQGVISRPVATAPRPSTSWK